MKNPILLGRFVFHKGVDLPQGFILISGEGTPSGKLRHCLHQGVSGESLVQHVSIVSQPELELASPCRETHHREELAEN